MQKNFFEEVIKIVVGSQGEKIADLLDDKNYLNEFLIAKRLDLTINQTRNILYRLSEFGLVSSIRKKDRKKGWYTYFWKIENQKILEFLKKELDKRIEQLKNQVKSRETKVFYFCERCSVEYSEENALQHNFTCDECGNTFAVKDNTKVIKEMKKGIDRLEAELNMVNSEMSLEKGKVTKKIEKDSRKMAKKKQKERASRSKIKKDNKAKEKSHVVKKEKISQKKLSGKKVKSHKNFSKPKGKK